MSAIPARCLQCQHDLRYDLINLRFRCPVCNDVASSVSQTEAWRKRGETVGRESARLLSKVERWLGK